MNAQVPSMLADVLSGNPYLPNWNLSNFDAAEERGNTKSFGSEAEFPPTG
jgi:hypothetical protein